ncbi:DUF685 domain-containing protein, partial [Borreliella garinii]|uniref:DUF685 domain-containing protein n=2 Tax=Borreliella garinii TaxID=29519 RepID=UPI001F4457C0
ELAANTDFVEKIYTKITDKLINHYFTNLSNLFSRIKSQLTNSISSATPSRSNNLLIVPNSSSIQKIPVPKQLLGVQSDYQYNDTTYGNTLYPYAYKNKSIYIFIWSAVTM